MSLMRGLSSQGERVLKGWGLCMKGEKGLKADMAIIVCFLVALSPSTRQNVSLERLATLELKVLIKLALSASHNVLTTGQPVVALTT